ncbi:GNAT family N-acetyltransferase [Kineosporia sp. J2-2]|uniref:GNAT family N-acetyltransferase n=1 Tax=Kineosporia corallincola TaxID=2835133 RepID=A0ABS5TAM5_9ACTN|nr:GNAT family N-acetyltransferase [Kineosporia corallincola]MBT0768096.1 GNAT family N-acetyltransferase [Kineosporia corallincola]
MPRLRPRAPSDLSALATMLRATHEQHRYPMIWPADPQGWLSPPGTAGAWVAMESDGTGLLGHVCVVTGREDPLLGSGFAMVSRLFTGPAARGRSLRLGELLLEAAGRWAGAHGLPLMLDVVDDGGAAVALYERLGWQLADRRVSDIRSPSGDPYPLRIYRAPETFPARS